MENEQDRMLLDYLMNEGAAQPEQAALQRRQARTDRLRQMGQAAPGGVMRGAGRQPGLYDGPSGLETAVGAATGVLGEYQQADIDKQQGASDAARQDRLKELLARYRAKQAASQMPSSQGMNWAGEPYTGGFGDER